jgi:hypothetical protein
MVWFFRQFGFNFPSYVSRVALIFLPTSHSLIVSPGLLLRARGANTYVNQTLITYVNQTLIRTE